MALSLAPASGFAYDIPGTVKDSAGAAVAAADQLVPDLDFPTIGDRMNDKGVSWAWYSGGWDSATAGKAAHLKDESAFIAALDAGTLPEVSFIKPVGVNNEIPGYADMKTDELHTASLIEAVKAGSIWNNSVIIITYDENGGLYDHVAQPVIDRWGPGSCVPTLVISPLAKTNYVDKHQLETVSILSMIERRFGLIPLTSRERGYDYVRKAVYGNRKIFLSRDLVPGK